MRVLMVSSLWPPTVIGGAELYAAQLATGLREQGHEIGVVTLGVPGDDVVSSLRPFPCRADEVRSSSGWRRPIFHAADVWRPDMRRTLAHAVELFKPDVVHTHVTQGMSIAALTSAHRLGLPHVHTLHDYWLRCWRSTMTRRNGGPCGPACRAIAHARGAALRRRPPEVLIAISQALLDLHGGIHGSRASRVLHHPVETPPQRTRTARNGAVFGYLGQLNPNKGVDVLLDAAQEAAASLVVAGRGRLEDRVRGCDADRVRYLGWVAGAEREQFFDSIDCLVVPSVWQEPAGLAVNEATARGIPVIASTTGGLPEYVPAACRPLLTPPGDSAALAQRMLAFSRDPQRFRPAPVDPSRSWSSHVDDIVDCYEQARDAA